jgi:parallel beta-helix repeat protein
VVGILFNSCSEGVASSNTFLDTSGTGISVLSSHYIALESNILNMLTTSTGGIVVGAGSSNITLSNNYVSSKTIDTTASSGSNIVTGNTARGSGNVVIHSTDIAYGNYGNNTTQNFLQRKLEPEYLSGTVIPIPDSRPGYETKMYILQGNITIANPVVSVAGQVMKFWLKQNEVGSHTVTFGGNYLFGNFVMPTDVYAGNSIEFMCVDGTYWAASAPYSV